MYKKHTINELFRFLKKSKIKAGEGLGEGIYPFYTSSNVLSKFLDYFDIEEASLIFGTGGSASVHYSRGMFSVSTDCFVLQPINADKIDIKFVYYYLLGNIQILEAGFKGAGLKHISKKYIQDLKIPLPPFETQKKIVEALDKAQSLIDMRKKQTELLDELVQSVFIDMFGDPVTNPKGWELRTLNNICIKITDGTHQSPNFVNDGVPFLFVSNIVDGRISYETKKFITEEEYDLLIKRTPVEIGDILYTTVGSYGNPAVVRLARKFCFQRHIAYLKPNATLVNSDYLAVSMVSSYFKHQLEKRVRGVAQKTLNLSDLKRMKVILPSIEVQNAFALRIQKIEEQKELIQQSLIKMENNFNSIMQKAFRGELFI